jgi:formylmethanofuran dehydrogenase subunit E-like metal-binding protein
VGANVGLNVGLNVGFDEGANVGLLVGANVGGHVCTGVSQTYLFVTEHSTSFQPPVVSI